MNRALFLAPHLGVPRAPALLAARALDGLREFAEHGGHAPQLDPRSLAVTLGARGSRTLLDSAQLSCRHLQRAMQAGLPASAQEVADVLAAGNPARTLSFKQSAPRSVRISTACRVTATLPEFSSGALSEK